MATSLLKTTLRAFLAGEAASIVKSDEAYVRRVLDQDFDLGDMLGLEGVVKHLGVTAQFRDVIDSFQVPEGKTPAGFRIEYRYEGSGLLCADLVRDISYGENGALRPTNVLFSADSANPYEVAPVKNLIANLTCNPGIIYDLFINNPKANVGNKFKTRDEVMAEIGRVLGPGADISVELNNPFASETEILEEAARFREMLSKYRVVIKVPHTGPVNGQNVGELLAGDKKFQRRWDEGQTEDFVRGHNLALMLHEHGYRVNFTLMFEPYQTALALQAKPYFINSFIRHRLIVSMAITDLLAKYRANKDDAHLLKLRSLLVDKDYLSPADAAMDLQAVYSKASWIEEYRQFRGEEGSDGLDAVRHSLRVLRETNLPDTRLIICSMEGDRNYPDIDRLLAGDEFGDMARRVVITTEPAYLVKFTSTPQVVTYQRRFMNAANGAK
ncbi:MAG: transaldolase family protein [Rectinemataceae bacterium]|nr:transaldolase family protein [Rectinemataceae bacterium]